MAEESALRSRAKNPTTQTQISSARPSSSPLRQIPPSRSSFADQGSPFARRRSSLISDSLDEARQSLRSSTDNLLLPKAQDSTLETHHDPSHWHSAPLALALLPAVGGLVFEGGSAVITDVTLLGLAAVFLNWSVRLPWDWYCSARSIRLLGSDASNDFYSGNNIIEEESEDDLNGHAASPDSESKDPIASPANSNPQSSPQDRAASELRVYELIALFACFFLPLVGAWLLHAIRSQLSRPSEGLVSNYNLTIFLLGSEIRPLSHLVRMIQSRTLYLQRITNNNPYEDEKVDKAKVLDLSKRLDELEAHVAEAATAKPSNGSSNGSATPSNSGQISTEVRKNLQPDLDALNRAVRRYEKRTTILAMQTESRLQDIELRMGDAITLAAAAERGHSMSRRSSSFVLLEWMCAAVVLPIQTAWVMVSFPGRMATKALGAAEGYVGEKVRKELKTAGRPVTGHGKAGGMRVQGRGSKKPS